MAEWTEKYRPKRLDDIIGNDKAKQEMIKWANSWDSGPPKKRALVLIGAPGIGKTTCALALANEKGWQVVEMNASDSRNAEAIRKVATSGAMGETFNDQGEFLDSKAGMRKLIILDEADNVFGREDYGGIKAMAATVLSTMQPVILIVNDYYSLKRRSSVLEKNVTKVQFQRPRQGSIKKVLRAIAKAEGVAVPEVVISTIAEQCGGDVRSAIKDLQSLSEGREQVRERDMRALGARDVPGTIFSSLAVLFRTGNCQRSRQSLFDLDEDPETLILWIDENIPNAYRDIPDMAAAYDALARADVYLGRVRRRQYYGMWGYATDMMSCGVSLARSRDYKGYVQYNFPRWLVRMSRSKSMRDARAHFCRRLGDYTRSSTRVALQDHLPYFQTLYTQDQEFRLSMTRRLRLSEEEVALLLGEKPDSNAVRRVFEALRKVEAAGQDPVEAKDEVEETEELEEQPGPGEPDEDEPEIQKSLFEFQG